MISGEELAPCTFANSAHSPLHTYALEQNYTQHIQSDPKNEFFIYACMHMLHNLYSPTRYLRSYIITYLVCAYENLTFFFCAPRHLTWLCVRSRQHVSLSCSLSLASRFCSSCSCCFSSCRRRMAFSSSLRSCCASSTR